MGLAFGYKNYSIMVHKMLHFRGYGFDCDSVYFTNTFKQINDGPAGWNADNDRSQMIWIDHKVRSTNIFAFLKF